MIRFVTLAVLLALSGCSRSGDSGKMSPGAIPITSPRMDKTVERQITRAPHGHILTNTGVWSPDSEWIVYDVRSDPAGATFDGTRVEAVNVRTGEVKLLYESRNGAFCGVATFHPKTPRVIFILGPESPTPDWSYGPSHRQGVFIDMDQPGIARTLDARDLTPPFTQGALRGGSHVHVWDAAGDWVSFTYEDAVVAAGRNIGVSMPGAPIRVDREHPRNHDGEFFSVLVTQTKAFPRPGSDEIKRAFEEGWIGTNGYRRSDGFHVQRALAFQGEVITASGEAISEVFVADLPDDLTRAGSSPLEGTMNTLPAPPRGTLQRRITFTADRPWPGIQGPRHWLRSSGDGSRIAFLMKDSQGVAQLWIISPNGGQPRQLTRNQWAIASAFTWSPDGRAIAHVMDNSLFVTRADTGESVRLSPRAADAGSPRPEACVFSPDGKKIAFVRQARANGETHNQIFVVDVD